MRTKTLPNESPAAQLETARAEHEAAEKELATLDIHRGRLDEAASRRRELQERVSIAKERLALAQDRFDEAEFLRIENEIAELQADAQQIENELAAAREQAASDLRLHLNGDWLAGTGRFASQRPALGGLLGFCISVSEVESRRDAVRARINHLERKIADRRQERSRQAAAARVDARKRLIAGEAVEIPLTPWRVECLAGFVQDVLDGLDRKYIPAALVDPRACEIHCLLPPETTPQRWIDGGHIESAEQMDPTALCPAMAGVWARAAASKKRAASR